MFESRTEDGGTGLRRGEEELTAMVEESRRTGRRMFLRWAGVSVAGVALAACNDTTSPGQLNASTALQPGTAVDLGSGDVGILNYAFALEQLESTFYSKVINQPYTGMTAQEFSILDDVRKHEKIHAKFFAAALGKSGIPFLAVSFAGVDFTSRQSVLTAARDFEDTGVSAYNGAGQLLKSSDYLLVAGKIVSVEARHAAAIRDLLNPKSADFAGDNVVDPTTGLDIVRQPPAVLSIVATYIKTPVDASHLPTAA